MVQGQRVIYQGCIAVVKEVVGTRLYINDENNECSYVQQSEVVEVNDVAYSFVEQELKAIREEIMRIIERMHRLDEEYQKKKENLRLLFMETRGKEISVITHLINSQNDCQK
jgi:hypothetical protein